MKKQYTVYMGYNQVTGDIYIGATSDYTKRVSCHISRARCTTGRADTTYRLYENIRQHSIENFSFTPISQHKNKLAMQQEEARLIKTLRPSLNSHMPKV